MKPPLVLFDIAMSKLSSDIKKHDFRQKHEYDPLHMDRHIRIYI